MLEKEKKDVPNCPVWLHPIFQINLDFNIRFYERNENRYFRKLTGSPRMLDCSERVEQPLIDSGPSPSIIDIPQLITWADKSNVAYLHGKSVVPRGADTCQIYQTSSFGGLSFQEINRLFIVRNRNSTNMHERMDLVGILIFIPKIIKYVLYNKMNSHDSVYLNWNRE